MSWATRMMRVRLVDYQRISSGASELDIRHLVFVWPQVQGATAPLYQPGDHITLHLPYPRVFAVASSPLAVRNGFHLTVRMSSVIEPDTLSYDELVALIAQPVGFSVTPQAHFRLPDETRRPLILFAEGAGIAPFRAFIQQRHWLRQRHGQREAGENWLFLDGPGYRGPGCRAGTLYQAEWQGYVRDEVLTRMDVAGDEWLDMPSLAEKVDELGSELWAWLCRGAAIYYSCSLACSEQLEQALRELILEQGQCTAQEGTDFLTHLKQQQRYQRMVYP